MTKLSSFLLILQCVNSYQRLYSVTVFCVFDFHTKILFVKILVFLFRKLIDKLYEYCWKWSHMKTTLFQKSVLLSFYVKDWLKIRINIYKNAKYVTILHVLSWKNQCLKSSSKIILYLKTRKDFSTVEVGLIIWRHGRCYAWMLRVSFKISF